MVAAAFIAFMLAICGVALHYYFQQALDFATAQAARQLQLGLVPAGSSQDAFVSQVFCPGFSAFQSCANLAAGVRPVTSYQQLATSGAADAPDAAGTTGLTFCTGQPGQLMYLHVVFLPPAIGVLFGANAAFGSALVANAAFANENPYGATVTPADGC